MSVNLSKEKKKKAQWDKDVECFFFSFFLFFKETMCRERRGGYVTEFEILTPGVTTTTTKKKKKPLSLYTYIYIYI